MPLPSLFVLRPAIWREVERHLEEAAAHHASVAAARDVLLRPLELLALMAADAPAGLGDDPLAAKRLRMLLHLAAPFEALVQEACPASKNAEAARSLDTEADYEPGVIDHAALVVVALAALRVAPPGSGASFVRTVQGLALSAAPAEALGRLVPRLLDAEGLAVIVNTFYLLDTVGAAVNTPFLRPFSSDPAERARCRALSGLLERDLSSVIASAAARAKVSCDALPWDGGLGGIESVAPERAAPGEAVVLTGCLDQLGRASALPAGLRVVFASPDASPLPAKVLAFSHTAKDFELRVEVPLGARPGWVGFSDDALLQSSNGFRAALREALPSVFTLRDVPLDAIPQIGTPDPERPGKLLARPPRTARNRWLGMDECSRGVERATPPGEERLSSSASVDQQSLLVVLVRPQIVDPPTPPVDREIADRWLESAGKKLGVSIETIELPWLDDELAVLSTPLSSGDDARVPLVFEALSRRAMLTQKLEGALWLLLAPDPAAQSASSEQPIAARFGFARTVPAVAARAVAVANLQGVVGVLEQLARADANAPMPSWSPPTPRLRLLGSIDSDEIVLESVREEVRSAGPGAPLDSGLVAAALDARGRQLLVAKVTCLREARPAHLAVLLPVSPDVMAVEVACGHNILARVTRGAGEPHLERALLGADALHWRFTHTHNVRPRVALGITRDRITTEVQRFGPCERSVALPVTRYGRADGLVLSAADGWNVDELPVTRSDGKPALLDNATPVLIRRLSDGRFFADAPQGWEVKWSFEGGSPLGSERVLVLPSDAQGTLTLEAASGPGKQPLVDRRWVEER